MRARRSTMNRYSAGGALALTLAVGIGTTTTLGQSSNAAVQTHVAAAKKAAGEDWLGVFNSTCNTAVPPAARAARAPAAPRPPDRSTWHAEPVKVFDNLYFLGQTEYSAWAVTTSQGIIVIDTIFDYSVEDEVVNGLKKLGLNPADIKYAVVSHAHTDHIGGAKYLQDHFGAKVVMSKEDWEFADRTVPERIRPKRDIEAKDDDKLTLG